MTENIRVGAILNASEKVCYFLGFGEYVGNEIPPDDTPGAFGTTKEMRESAEDYFKRNNIPEENRPKLLREMLANPKIVLDNGAVVWGRQCWWGSENNTKSRLILYERVDLVDIHGNVLQKNYKVG